MSIICGKCNGLGRLLYENTATYLDGIGGDAMTSDLCNECWGSGDSNKPFTNIKKLYDYIKTSRQKLEMWDDAVSLLEDVVEYRLFYEDSMDRDTGLELKLKSFLNRARSIGGE